MPSPWIERALRGELPAVDKTGHIYTVDADEAWIASQITLDNEPSIPDWAIIRVEQGLCAVIDGRCITHDAVADFGHYLDTRDADHDPVTGFAYND